MRYLLVPTLTSWVGVVTIYASLWLYIARMMRRSGRFLSDYPPRLQLLK